MPRIKIGMISKKLKLDCVIGWNIKTIRNRIPINTYTIDNCIIGEDF
jgi:hypothetical protein